MLRLITAWSSEDLADWLAGWYSASSDDPFQRELVVVPTPGMERYVTRRLAQRLGVSGPHAGDGVCAAVDFVQPQDLMAAVLADVSDDESDPWIPATLQWYCLRAIDELVERPDQGAASSSARRYARREADGGRAPGRSSVGQLRGPATGPSARMGGR